MINTKGFNAQLLPPEFITEGTFAVILHRQAPGNEETTEETTERTTEETTERTTERTTEETTPITTPITTRITRGKTRGITRGKNRDLIIEMIRQNDQITTTQLAESLGITIDGVDYHIRKLKEDGVIVRQGPKYGGKWIINPKK